MHPHDLFGVMTQVHLLRRALTAFETTAIFSVTADTRLPASFLEGLVVAHGEDLLFLLCSLSLPVALLTSLFRAKPPWTTRRSKRVRQSRSKPRRRQARSTAAKPTKTNSTGAPPRQPPAPGRARPIQVVGRSARAAHVRADGQPKERLENRGLVSCG